MPSSCKAVAVLQLFRHVMVMVAVMMVVLLLPTKSSMAWQFKLGHVIQHQQQKQLPKQATRGINNSTHQAAAAAAAAAATGCLSGRSRWHSSAQCTRGWQGSTTLVSHG